VAELKKIFEALMLEAHSDIRSAKLLLDGAEFSRSIYHSQQAVEKAMIKPLRRTQHRPHPSRRCYERNADDMHDSIRVHPRHRRASCVLLYKSPLER